MAQDCFLTFGICRQIIMMQPGKLSILPLESKQWGLTTYNSKSHRYRPIAKKVIPILWVVLVYILNPFSPLSDSPTPAYCKLLVLAA